MTGRRFSATRRRGRGAQRPIPPFAGSEPSMCSRAITAVGERCGFPLPDERRHGHATPHHGRCRA